MIPEQFIDELVSRLDIADVVSDYVSLTKKGVNMFGLCPFHSEKTASFSVNSDKQIYHCFGCGKGGGVINFIMEIENLSFVDAVVFLAKRAGMVVPEDDAKGARDNSKRRENILELNRFAARWFHNNLMNDIGSEAMKYLDSRGLRKGTVIKFGLGFSPDLWDGLINAAIKNGYEKFDLVEAGLAVKNRDSGRIYDRFRNRLMFPIIDVRGNVIGFGGRVMDDSLPKYLNSPDTLVFNKSKNLFSLNLAKNTKREHLILSEGYMDVISLHQAGFDCAVASLGTSLTADHARLLSRYTKSVIIAYDSDNAGKEAAQRAIGILNKTDLEVKVLNLPGAKDPDEYIKKFGKEAFEKLLSGSQNHMEYRLLEAASKYDLSNDEQKIEFLENAAGIICEFDSAVAREIYGARAAELAGVSAEIMKMEIKRVAAKRNKYEARRSKRKEMAVLQSVQPKEKTIQYSNVKSARAEEGIIRTVLIDPTLFDHAANISKEIFTSEFLWRTFSELKEKYLADKPVTIAGLAGTFSNEEISHLTEIALKPESKNNLERTFLEYIEILNAESMKRNTEVDMLQLQSEYKKTKGYRSRGIQE